MITEEQQDQAALYVLESLDQNETTAFEVALQQNSELRDLVKGLREAAGAVALAAPGHEPPPALKQRVLNQISAEKGRSYAESSPSISAWPWAIAAMFVLFSGFLVYDRMQLRREISQMKGADPLTQMHFAALSPANGGPSEAKAVVAWEPARQSGVITITGLPSAGNGKDYQLWAVDADHKDPVSAGIVHVDQDGTAQVRFKPIDSTNHVQAFAISVEREGGVPKAEGPIILVGKTT